MDVRAARLDALDELLRVALAIRRHVDEVAARHDLSGPQARLLLTLEEPLRMHAAAVATSCEPSHLTALAEQLQRSGMLVREVDPTDRRARVLALTEQGQAKRAELVPALLEGAPVIAGLDAKACLQLVDLLQDDPA